MIIYNGWYLIDVYSKIIKVKVYNKLNRPTLLQLNPIERYAMRFVEETGGLWTAEQLRAAEAEIEQQKREWEANRLAALEKERAAEEQRQQEDELLTYSRVDAKNQVNRNKSKSNKKPPPLSTPHANNNRANRKRGATEHSLRDKTPTSPTNKHSKQGVRVALAAQKSVARKRATSRSTVSNHSGSERMRRKSLAMRSPSVAPSVSAAKRSKVVSTATEPTDPMTKRVQHVERNSKARAALLTKNRREAAAKRRMMLHKKALSTSRVKEESVPDGGAQDNDVTGKSCNALMEEEDSSECSLDAMYDSIDDADGDDQSEEVASKQDVSSNEDDETEEEEERRPRKAAKSLRNGKSHKKNRPKSPSSSDTEESSPENNHFDIYSPRSTRSRGTVKLNLWTLDVSPIVAPKTPKRRSKTNQSAAGDDEPPNVTSTLPANHVVKISIAHATTTEAEEDSCASVGSLKQALIRDGFDSNSKTLRRKTNAQNNAPKKSANATTNKNTLDNWISKSPRTMRALSPMVMLNKDEVSRHMQPPAQSSSSVRPSKGEQLSEEALLVVEQQLVDIEMSTKRRTRSKSVHRAIENGQTG